MVERTFVWIFQFRRLARDNERITRVAEALITVAAIAIVVKPRMAAASNTLR